MTDAIDRILLSELNSKQKTLVTILCEYYMEKIKNEKKKNIALSEEKSLLEEEMSVLRASVSLLRKKLKSAHNVIRLLSNTDNTPSESPNIIAINRLLLQKVNEVKNDRKRPFINETNIREDNSKTNKLKNGTKKNKVVKTHGEPWKEDKVKKNITKTGNKMYGAKFEYKSASNKELFKESSVQKMFQKEVQGDKGKSKELRNKTYTIE